MKRIKLQKSNKIFFTADTHFGHSNIIRLANLPFSSIYDKDELQITNWNNIVPKDGIVFHAGDFALKCHPKRYSEILYRLNGKIYLCEGSHDKDAWKHLERFEEISDTFYLTIEDIEVFISHYNHKVWPKSHYGSLQIHGHCFSDDTELLTENGFINYKDIKIGQKALTLNIKNNELEYNSVQNIFVYDNIRSMVQFDSVSGKILVTPEHTMLYLSYDKTIKKETAIKSMQRKCLSIPLVRSSKGEITEEAPEFFTLLGLIISDGHFHYQEGKNAGNGISIYQKNGKEQFIEETLNCLNVPYKKHSRKISDINMIIFYLPAYWVKENIYKYIKEKDITNKLMGIRDTKFNHLISGLIFGDGWVTGKHKTQTKETTCVNLQNTGFDNQFYTYCTISKQLADKICHLCTLNGISAKLYSRCGGFNNSKAWYISMSKRQNISFRTREKKIVPYHGNTWCVQVCNETLVVRRNGLIFITGNSHGRLDDYNSKEGKILDVAVETNNYTPVSLEKVIKIMNTRPLNFNDVTKGRRG